MTTQPQNPQEALTARLERWERLAPKECTHSLILPVWRLNGVEWSDEWRYLSAIAQAAVQAECDARGWHWSVSDRSALVVPTSTRFVRVAIDGPPALALLTAYCNALEAEQARQHGSVTLQGVPGVFDLSDEATPDPPEAARGVPTTTKTAALVALDERVKELELQADEMQARVSRLARDLETMDAWKPSADEWREMVLDVFTLKQQVTGTRPAAPCAQDAPAPAPYLRHARELAATWRTYETREYEPLGDRVTYGSCARELEAALNSLPPAPPTIDGLLEEIKAAGMCAAIHTYTSYRPLCHVRSYSHPDAVAGVSAIADTPLAALQQAFERAKAAEKESAK